MIGLSFSEAREKIISEIHEYLDNINPVRKIDNDSNNSRNLLILISTTITGIVLLIVVIPYSRYY